MELRRTRTKLSLVAIFYRHLPFRLQMPEQQSVLKKHASFFTAQGQSASVDLAHCGPQHPSISPQAGKSFRHPRTGSQASTEHASPSSQAIWTDWHTPSEHVSVVQALPSSQSTDSTAQNPASHHAKRHASDAVQSPSPEHDTAQSTGQLERSSTPSHTRSPQHDGVPWDSIQDAPPPQRASSHPTGL